MSPATEVEAKAAVERFAQLSRAEQDEIMARGRRIEALDDLKGLPAEDVGVTVLTTGNARATQLKSSRAA